MRRRAVMATGLLALAGCGHTTPATSNRPATGTSGTAPPTNTTTGTPAVTTIVTGLAVPWSLALLPDGQALVSERPTDRILRLPAKGGTPVEVMRVPGVATDTAEGGLLGIAVSPLCRRPPRLRLPRHP